MQCINDNIYIFNNCTIVILQQNSELEIIKALKLFVNSDGSNSGFSRDGVDQIHDLPVLTEVPRLNSRHSAGLQGSLRKIGRCKETFKNCHLSFCTWSLMILFPLRLAVVLTSVPSPVVSTKGTPNSNWMEVDLKVEEVSMPTVSPPRFLFVAVG